MYPIRLFVLAASVVMVGLGCDRSTAPPSGSLVPYALTSQQVAHFHWRGKKLLTADTNAVTLLQLWEAPEGEALAAHFLDKLSLAPWRVLPHVATTNATVGAPLLRSLFEDCLVEESYLEVRAATNQPGELAFAIHLPAARAGMWETNLAAVLESLTGLHPEAAEKGWVLQKHKLPNRIEFTRVGEWAVVGVGQDQNALVADFGARILRDHTPIPPTSAEFWVDGELDWRRVSEAFQLEGQRPEGLPKFALQITGGGQSVQTHGTLDFPQPLRLALEPWNLPTNLLRGHLGSFTALRGFEPWLAGQKRWDDLQAGPAPNQFFVWSGLGVPMQTLFAAPVPAASNRLEQISEHLMQQVDPWLVAHQAGHLERATEFNGVSWVGMPFLGPYLRAAGDFIFGGFFPAPAGKFLLSPDLLMVLNRTNTVYYDWEITSPRIESWFYIGQTLRLVLHRPQLPAESASAVWLQAQTNSLGNCVTTISQTAPAQLTFVRRSSLGLTAFELHLLGDWLESPQFPLGLNTLMDRPELQRPRKRPIPAIPPPPQ